MSQDSAADRVASLRREIERHNQLYYIEARSEITDQAFDRLMHELQELEKAHPELASPDSPTQRVGGQPLDEFRTVTHARPMMSIDNTYSREELLAWDQRVRKGLQQAGLLGTAPEGGLFDATGLEAIKYIVEPKVDGVSANLRYEAGRLVLGATRGDGKQGDDITANLRTIRGIPLKLQAPPAGPGKSRWREFPGVLEVRGEVYMTNQQFDRINEARAQAGEEAFANPRNSTAGTLKLLDSRIVARRHLRFIAHGLGECPPEFFATRSESFEAIQAWGIPVNPARQVCKGIDEVWHFIRDFENKRATLDYNVDGVVVKVDRLDWSQTLGATSKSPRWCIAYKYAAEQAQTGLLGITWQVGKLGTVTPVAELEPVLLAGTTVKRASLHNIDQIRRLDVRVGDTVTIEKAGEIIPQVVAVASAAARRTAAVEPPAKCPSCGGPVTRAPEEAALRCTNPECPAQIRERLIWFAARGQMDIEGLGEKSVNQLADAGLLQSFGDIYRLKDHRTRLLELERMGAKKVDNLLEGIDASKKRGLARVLAGLGIRHVGGRAAQTLAARFRDIQALQAATPEELQDFQVEGKPSGIGPEIAASVHAFFASAAGRHVVQDLRAAGLDLTAPKAPQRAAGSPASQWSGRTVVITGTLESFERQELKDKLEALGAKVTDSVSKKTNVLIVGAAPGSKLDKAQSLGVEIWDEKRLLNELS